MLKSFRRLCWWPHYRLRPPCHGTPTKICANLILPESEVHELHFCIDNMGVFFRISEVSSERRMISVGLVTFRLRFDSHRRAFASNLEQVANLLRAQVNSASYPQWDGKWLVAYGLRGEGLVWLIGAAVCLLAADRGSSCSLTRAMDGRIVHCGIISSCQSAATSEIVKHFWSRVWLM